ncbi:MAG TPA: O-methyltransferase [Caulobacteraceae bacterium]
MPQDQWTAIDRYLTDALLPHDAALAAALASSDAAGLPAIAVAPNQGRMLEIFARSIGAKRILEIGTLGGYSTIWLAKALPADGRLISLEFDPHHAAVAAANIAHAGFADLVEVRVGRAIDNLPIIEREGRGPFDLVFIDADKPSNPDYFAWALKLTAPGSLIIVDNVVRAGAVANADSRDPNVLGVQRMNQMIAAESRVVATAVQTVGSKGHDGFALILVTG